MYENITLISPSNEEFACEIDLSGLSESELLSLFAKQLDLDASGNLHDEYQLTEENHSGHRVFKVNKQGEMSMTKLLILVHGFGADEKGFWGSTPTALSTHTSLHSNFDVKFWGYQTTKAPMPIWSKLSQKLGIGLRTQTLEQLGQNLWSDLRELTYKKNYSQIKLLGHSMGGLVVASAVGYGLQLQESRDAGLISTLQAIAFVATPLGGANLAEIVRPVYKLAGENIHRRDLEENSVSRKSIVTRFIQLALEKHSLSLKIFRAANDSVVNEEELTRPLRDGSYELDVLRGGHSQCIQNLEAGQENLSKLVRWIAQ